MIWKFRQYFKPLISKRTSSMQLSCFSCSRNVLCWFVTECKINGKCICLLRGEQERWVWFGNSLTSAPAGVDCTSLPGLVSRTGHSSSLKQPFETGLSCRFHSLYIDQAGLTQRSACFWLWLDVGIDYVPPHSAKGLIIKPFGVRKSTGSWMNAFIIQQFWS